MMLRLHRNTGEAGTMHARLAFCIALLCATSAYSQEQPKPVELRVKADGGVVWNGTSISDAIFEERLAETEKQQPRPRFHIVPNPHATFQGISHLLKMIQSYGCKLGLVTGQPRL